MREVGTIRFHANGPVRVEVRVGEWKEVDCVALEAAARNAWVEYHEANRTNGASGRSGGLDPRFCGRGDEGLLDVPVLVDI